MDVGLNYANDRAGVVLKAAVIRVSRCCRGIRTDVSAAPSSGDRLAGIIHTDQTAAVTSDPATSDRALHARNTLHCHENNKWSK